MAKLWKWLSQDEADATMQAALDTRNEKDLAEECERRLRALRAGTTLAFRLPGGKRHWMQPVRPLHNGNPLPIDFYAEKWGRDAAKFLLANDTSRGSSI